MIKIIYAHRPEIEYLKKILATVPVEIEFCRWPSVNSVCHEDLTGVLNSGVKPELVLNAGFAGRLNPDLSVGDTILVDKLYVDYNGKRGTIKLANIFQTAAEQFALDKNILVVSLNTSEVPIIRKESNEKMWRETGADLVDMEAYHIYKAAAELGIPFMSLKIISDGADGESWANIKKNHRDLSKKLGEFAMSFITLFNNENLCGNTGT